jgi:hypothetical protein
VLNQIVHVTDDMKPLVSLLLCQGTIQLYFITQEESDKNNGKRQNRDRTTSRAVFKRNLFLKTIFERRKINFH